MSDGGKVNSEIECVGGNGLPKRASAEEFGREVSKIAAAQICDCVGFDSSNESALEALADIMVRFTCDLGKTASFYANVAGRAECNFFDVVQGLEDLCSFTGFTGVSEGVHHVTSSGVVNDIVEYVGSAEEIPFAQPIPYLPVAKKPRTTPSFMQIGETPASNHIPSWLPAFPDPHTYVHTPTWNQRETDPREDKIELARQRRKAERSLLSLQQRLLSSSSEANGGMRNVANFVEFSNPFRGPPIKAGETDISPIPPANLSNENNVSVLATFSPALEAVSNGMLDSHDNGKNLLPDKRHNVRLNFKSNKKILSEPLDLRLRHKGSKALSHTGREDDKDDKKKRAELIIRLSTENPHVLTQL